MRWLLLALVLSASPALADEAPPSIVHASLDGGMARVTARYLVMTGEAGIDTRILELPDGALVTATTVTADGEAHRLQLLEVADAAAKLEAIETAPPGIGMRRWAASVIATGANGMATVALAAPHAGLVSLEVELSAPTCYVAGARWVRLPPAWGPAIDHRLRGMKAPAQVESVCGGGPVWVGMPSDELAKRPAGVERIGGSAGRLALGTEHVARIELDLASKLGDVPRDLATVILVDMSRSIDDRRVLEQRRLVMAYLRRVPESRVQILGFARTAHPILPGWMAASQALPRVERLLAAEPLRNGSNIDDALADAASWLAKVSGTHRIVLLSDELVPERIDAAIAGLRGVLSPDTLVHVVALDGGDELARDDAGVLSPLAASTFGMLVRGGLPASGDVEMLVRPVSFDAVRIRGGTWSEVQTGLRTCSFAEPSRIVEGESCTWWVESDPAASLITVDGLVWGQRVTRTFAPDLGQSRALARELSGHGTFDGERRALVDREARAVNSVWSLFGSWGGKGGYEGLGGGGTGWGSVCGCGDFGTIGHGSMGSAGSPREHFEEQLASAIAQCHAERDKVDVTLELTLNEIVDVAIAIQDSPDRDLAGALRHRHDCLVEAVWATDLVVAAPRLHTSVTVQLGK